MIIIPDVPFVEFPKISRLSREIVVTEKIDGTNASIHIPEPGVHPPDTIFVASRTRWISTDQDNHGFAKWVDQNREELLKLGPGHHFGEWWGSGIQRGYNLKEKRFSLFNVHRWWDDAVRPKCCHVVPILYRGIFSETQIETALSRLAFGGSAAAPGYMRPEGIVVFHTAGGQLFKKTLEKDDQPKGANR